MQVTMNMKSLQLYILLFSLASCAVAQPNTYTSTNKKAIKAFQTAEACYGDMDRLGKKDNDCIEKNYAKAFEIDPGFMEAYMMLSQHYMDIRNNDKAIEVLKKSHAKNPTFFINTWFLLAELEYKRGEYTEAMRAMNEYLHYAKGRVPQDMQVDVDRITKSCEFAIEAKKKPLNFTPTNLGPGVNTKNPEYFPTITGDDQMLLFTRRVPEPTAPMGEQEDFYYSIYDNGKWTKSYSISNSINTILNEGAPSISADGEILIFTACDLMGTGDYGQNREGLGSCDLFYSQKYNGEWTRAMNLGSQINSANWETQPSYSADGTALYFIRGKKNSGPNRSGDIYVSRLDRNGAWQTPERLPDHINTTKDEASVLIHPDGQTLYFSSNGHVGMGGYDLYMCRLQPDGNWSQPMNLGYPINTFKDENSLLVSSKGDIAFFASNRDGGFGDLDLYSFPLDESIRPVYTTYMKGFVYDSISKAKLEARFELTDLETGKLVTVSASNEKGEFFMNIATNKQYALSVNKKGYTFYSKNFSFDDDGSPKDKVFILKVPMVPITTTTPVATVLKNVFFDTDKFDLKPKSYVELNKLVDFLTQNPTLKIELHGHTDNEGDDAHNMTLSDNRAKSVMNYLISKGIDKTRLKAKGFGETKPVATNDTKEGRAENRRTEYVIVK